MINKTVKHYKLAMASAVLVGATVVGMSLSTPSLALDNQPAVGGSLPELTQMIKRTSPAVVNISVEGKSKASSLGLGGRLDQLPEPLRDFFRNLPRQPNGSGYQPRSYGSGFIISADGYIITNAHVVDGADTITVSLNDKREYEAKLVGSDKLSDVALLKVEGEGLPTVELGNSDQLDVGQWVVAIGAPFGLDFTATQGIVSALSRSLPSETYVPFIQTDAAVNPGNSGGPLFDLQGRVIGVNSQIYSRSGGYMGVSFAIPVNVVKNVTDQLRNKGQVSRGWLGVEIQNISPKLAQSFQLKDANGALVASVIPGSPADKAGVQAGDVILNYNNSPVNSSSDLPLLVGNTAVGSQVGMTVWRAGEAVKLTPTIDELAGDGRKASMQLSKLDKGSLGVAVEALTEEARKEYKTGNRGVIIREVVSGSAAAEAGLEKDDIILAVNNKLIDSPQKLKDVVTGHNADKPMAILFMRDGRTRFVAVSIDG